MIAELVGFLGTSVGGAIFGQVASFISRRAEMRSQEEQRKHEQTIAASHQLADYMDRLARQPDNPVRHKLGYVIWVLATTYCACTLLCFCFPNDIVHTLDPNESPRTVNIFWGLFSWNLAQGKVITITTGGVGLSLCYPIVFILSAVCTGIVPRKIR